MWLPPTTPLAAARHALDCSLPTARMHEPSDGIGGRYMRYTRPTDGIDRLPLGRFRMID